MLRNGAWEPGRQTEARDGANGDDDHDIDYTVEEIVPADIECKSTVSFAGSTNSLDKWALTNPLPLPVDLPFTGGNWSMTVAVGLGIVLAGLASVCIRNRRNSQHN